MSDENNDGIPEVDAQTVHQWLEGGDALLIDVREAHEFEYENVPRSLLLPLSFLDADEFPALHDKKLVFMCAVGKRSLAAAKQLADAGWTDIHNLTGGLDGWKNAGFDTQGGRFEAMDYSI